MFPVFEIPDSIERDLLSFFGNQQAFFLTDINPRASADEPVRAELSRHYGVYVLYYRGRSRCMPIWLTRTGAN